MPWIRVEVPQTGGPPPDGVIAHRLVILDPFPPRRAVKGEHEKQVSDHSTSPSLTPGRTGLSVGSSREDGASPCLRALRTWRLPVLSVQLGESALMQSKGSAIRVDQGRDCTPIKVRLAL